MRPRMHPSRDESAGEPAARHRPVNRLFPASAAPRAPQGPLVRRAHHAACSGAVGADASHRPGLRAGARRPIRAGREHLLRDAARRPDESVGAARAGAGVAAAQPAGGAPARGAAGRGKQPEQRGPARGAAPHLCDAQRAGQRAGRSAAVGGRRAARRSAVPRMGDGAGERAPPRCRARRAAARSARSRPAHGLRRRARRAGAARRRLGECGARVGRRAGGGAGAAAERGERAGRSAGGGAGAHRAPPHCGRSVLAHPSPGGRATARLGPVRACLGGVPAERGDAVARRGTRAAAVRRPRGGAGRARRPPGQGARTGSLGGHDAGPARVAGDTAAPPDAQALAQTAIIEALIAGGQLDDAAKRLETEGRLAAEDRAALRLKLARARITKGELDLADAALARDSSVDALALRGWVALYRGRLKDAGELFRAAGPYAGDRRDATDRSAMLALLQQIPLDSFPELGRSLLTLAHGDSLRAVEALRLAASRLAPGPGGRGRPDLLLLAGRVAVRLDTMQQRIALALFDEIIRTAGQGAAAPAAELEWARLLERRAQAAEAIAHLEHLILTYPGSAVVPEARRELERAKGAIPKS